MIKNTDYCENVEKLLCLVAENQKFASGNDKLSELVEKFSDFFSCELTEDELMLVSAAELPAVPKYKAVKDLQ